MPQICFSPQWINQFSDPYAVLGVSVAANDRRVLKRYHAIVKILHPDSDALHDARERELAQQLLTHLVNPAYQKLKQEKSRADVTVLMRLRARQFEQTEALLPKSEVAQQLLRVPLQEVDVFYEQAIANLAESQFHPLSQFEFFTQQIAELNLLYFHLKTNAPLVREKSTGIVAAQQAKPAQFSPSTTATAQMAVSYAQRHYQRAQEYVKKRAWSQAVAELRDAIRLEANRSDYHSLLAIAYLMQNLPGMAKVHLRQALKLNPNDPLALQYAAKLDLTPPATSVKNTAQETSPRNSASKGSGGLFNLFAKRK
ncbi:MAG: tetratricopeptide repeat protein [Elainellaceae cyanobacterium]